MFLFLFLACVRRKNENFLRKWQRASSRDALFRAFTTLPPLIFSLLLFSFSLLCPLFESSSLSFFLALMWLCFRVLLPFLFICLSCVYEVLALPRFDFFHLFFTILLDTLTPSSLCFPLCLAFASALHVPSHYLRNDLIAYSYVILTVINADTIYAIYNHIF